MNYLVIRDMPTSLKREELVKLVEVGSAGAHESLLRAYHILAEVRWMLERHTPPIVMMKVLDLMEGRDDR